MKKKIIIPLYLKEIITKYPKITSGRKNYWLKEKKIKKTISLINNYNHFIK